MSRALKKSVRDNLTPKDEVYCRLRVEGMAVAESYKRAFKPKSKNSNTIRSAASRIEHKPAVIRRIASLEARIGDKVAERVATDIALTRNAIINELWDNAMRAKAAVPVFDREGKPTGEYQTNLSASNRAFELLGKEIGMFKEGGNERDPLEALSYEQAQRLIDLITGKANEPLLGDPVGLAAVSGDTGGGHKKP